MNENPDQLVMLLSTDWFSKYWPAIEIDIPGQRKATFQNGCREIVRQIMSDAEQYWLTSFSEERVEETSSMLQALLRKCGAAKPTIDRINASSARKADDSRTKAEWLIVQMTTLLLANSPQVDSSQLNPSIREALAGARDTWNQRDLDEVDFEELCLNSKSEWDQYIKGLTPDLPTMLSDYLNEILEGDKFSRLWGFVNGSLDSRQKHELLAWYRTTAKSLTDRELALPELLYS
jgi:hypothetical protein